MRTPVDYSSASKKNYADFKKKHPTIQLSYEKWMNIVYSFNEAFRDYLLETGEKEKLPYGIGDFCIVKKKRKIRKTLPDGRTFMNCSIDWQKTRAKGKRIYNFNYETEGFFFGWKWFYKTARFKFSNLWKFKACRPAGRLLSHYIKTDKKYQYIYKEL